MVKVPKRPKMPNYSKSRQGRLEAAIGKRVLDRKKLFKKFAELKLKELDKIDDDAERKDRIEELERMAHRFSADRSYQDSKEFRRSSSIRSRKREFKQKNVIRSALVELKDLCAHPYNIDSKRVRDWAKKWSPLIKRKDKKETLKKGLAWFFKTVGHGVEDSGVAFPRGAWEVETYKRDMEKVIEQFFPD